ncbi:hypothetical protein [Wolbachia endosymbiont of Brugia pahangi]|uniref:hypothetical protein n=1 Tax=Wolbachia endosymbiont of Brugia pahangi TaxID=96495 RepID=UPI001FEBB9B3|nr:hypothetical protein [Wolbachia endosymbiont of Brugia pahangi]
MQTLLKNRLCSLYFIVPLFVFYIIINFHIFSLIFGQFSAVEDLKKGTKAYRQPNILDRNEVVIATNVPQHHYI